MPRSSTGNRENNSRKINFTGVFCPEGPALWPVLHRKAASPGIGSQANAASASVGLSLVSVRISASVAVLGARFGPALKDRALCREDGLTPCGTRPRWRGSSGLSSCKGLQIDSLVESGPKSFETHCPLMQDSKENVCVRRLNLSLKLTLT